jgi:hypothetical protein
MKKLFLLLMAMALVGSAAYGADQTRFPNGVATDGASDPFGAYIMPNPLDVYMLHEDFMYFSNNTGFIVSGVASAPAARDENGGWYRQECTNDVANLCYIEGDKEQFIFEDGKRLWFAAKFRFSNSTNLNATIGLMEDDDDPVNGLPGKFVGFFTNSTVTPSIYARVANASDTYSHLDTGADFTNGTAYDLSFYYDGAGEVKFYVNSVHYGSIADTYMHYGDSGQTDEYKPAFFYGAGGVNAGNPDIDFDDILVTKER